MSTAHVTASSNYEPPSETRGFKSHSTPQIDFKRFKYVPYRSQISVKNVLQPTVLSRSTMI